MMYIVHSHIYIVYVTMVGTRVCLFLDRGARQRVCRHSSRSDATS